MQLTAARLERIVAPPTVGIRMAAAKLRAEGRDILLAEHGVALVPGSAFLSPGYFRISFAEDDEILREAYLRIRRFCANLH